MREGEPGSFACVILEGEVDVFVELPAGPILMATVGRNRIIGELGVFTDMPRTATVVARTYLVVVRIEQRQPDAAERPNTRRSAWRSSASWAAAWRA